MFVPNFGINPSTLKCINCGKRPSGQYIQLKQGNIIDPMCLQEIQKLCSIQQLDQGIKQVYDHILKLVVKCTYCKNTINKLNKNGQNNKNDNILCNQCTLSPSKKVQKLGGKQEKVLCFQCQSELVGFNLLNAVQIDQIYICRYCIDDQDNRISQPKEEKKVEMLNLIKIQKKNELNHKKSMPNILPSYKPQQQNNLKNPFSFNYELQKYPILPKNKLLQKKPLKIQHIKCELCQQFLTHDKFDQIYQGLYICIICMKNHVQEEVVVQNKPKKQQVSKNQIAYQTFGLQDLFGCQQTEKTPKQKIKSKQTIQILQKGKKEQTVLQNSVRKSTIYQLKQCKLCFFAQAKMINIKCRHLMMCQKCYKSYQNKHNKKQEIPCPVCTVVGKYQIYIEPIYT